MAEFEKLANRVKFCGAEVQVFNPSTLEEAYRLAMVNEEKLTIMKSMGWTNRRVGFNSAMGTIGTRPILHRQVSGQSQSSLRATGARGSGCNCWKKKERMSN
ncbi:hypothetical protein H6P81_019596 [Aristolochia fimbriata]|uniref:Uncharacterized protein n=1 Tax=Aristolochia fimbriata TaxID=158543 RepID=A0AAV7DTB0_ARIFI|nr:hypothetical protein H6P81_019596 [Aristolochia fimbriata]